MLSAANGDIVLVSRHLWTCRGGGQYSALQWLTKFMYFCWALVSFKRGYGVLPVLQYGCEPCALCIEIITPLSLIYDFSNVNSGDCDRSY